MTPARRDIVVIAASAGGVEALMKLFGELPGDLDATVAVVLHRSPFYESDLPAVLGRYSELPVSEPADGEPFQRGRIYVAPRDHHLRFDQARLRLDRGAKEHYTRPSADPLFRSAARWHKTRVIGIVLTGSGDDGVSGLIAINAAGGLTLAQDPAESPHDSMPIHAITRDHVAGVLTLKALAFQLPRLVAGGAVEPDPEPFVRPA